MTVTSPNTQRVGQPITLTCNATTVRGITSRVGIIWRRDGNNLTSSDILPTMMDGSLLYTDTYTISSLSTDDDGRDYECRLVLYVSPVIRDSDIITMDVTGMYVW